jgi:hypothetical protein
MQRSSIRLHPSTQIRTAEVATSEVRQLCLPATAHVSPAQNSSASPTIEKSQLTGSSLSALEPRQIARKPCRRTVLPAAAYCAEDPRATLNRQTHPSNMQWPRIELLPRSHDLLACLHVIAYVSLPTCPSFLTGGVSYSVRRMLNRSFGGSNLQSVTAA